MILDYHEQLAGRVRDAIRAAFDAQLDQVSFQYPPRLGARRPGAAPRPSTWRKIAEAQAARDRGAAGRRRCSRCPACARRRSPAAATSTCSSSAHRSLRELVDALREPRAPRSVPGRVIVEHTSINPNKAAHIGHLRNAVLGDTLRAGAARTAATTWACRTTSTTPACRWPTWWWASCTSRRRPAPRWPRSTGKFDYYCWDLYAQVGDFYAADPAQQGAAGGDAARDRGRRQRDGAPRRRTWPRASSTATSPPWSGSASATTCSPTRATSCACTSGTAPSSC